MKSPNSASVIRTSTRQRAYGIVREALVQDTRLSAGACRLAVWLAIRPPGWVVHPEHAMRVLGMGKDAYYSARKQLTKLGYIAARQQRDQDGRMSSWDLVFDQELDAAVSGLAGSGQSGSGESGSGQPGDIVLTPPVLPPVSDTTTTGAAEPCGGGEMQGARDSLAWPGALTTDELAGVQRVLLGSGWPGQDEAQALLDELAGVMAQGKARNPVALLRKLLQRLQVGEFTRDVGPGVREAREARQRHEERLSRQTTASAPALAPAVPQSEAAKVGLAKARSALKRYRSGGEEQP